MFMLEKAVVGSRRYWCWIGFLVLVILWGFYWYLVQLHYGLGLTGMSRNVSWGLYIGQFTFLVGVAASAVMVVAPFYLHNHREFARMTILGECLAVAAVTTCLIFITVDMGKPMRILNVIIYPHPNSLMFWDMVSLSGYLLINAVVTVVTLHAEQKAVAPPRWIMPIVFLSIPWAVSIHTVTAFLYCGLPGRLFWLTPLLAPRFLAGAFCSGPALLILLCMLIRRLNGYDVGRKAISSLAVIVTYALVLTVFFQLMELFTSLYSHIPELAEETRNLYLGTPTNHSLAPWGQLSIVGMFVAMIMLLFPQIRRNERTLAIACVLTFVSIWADKGIGLVVGGFMPSPFNVMTTYVPTFPEISISVGIWAIGALMVTVFYKSALSIEATADIELAHGHAQVRKAA
jgi:[DsrC]-trisulfide reductase subunit P